MAGTGPAGARDPLFLEALSDTHSPIVQRRSGKPDVGLKRPPPCIAVAEYLPFPLESTNPVELLESGKCTARALASALKNEQRLVLARSFCAEIIKTFWVEIQKRYKEKWALAEDPTSDPALGLTEPGHPLARAMGEAAARLDPIIAGYLIGSTYTAMLPDETRSRWGVYYTPPGLTRRLLRMATVAGVDWQTAG